MREKLEHQKREEKSWNTDFNVILVEGKFSKGTEPSMQLPSQSPSLAYINSQISLGFSISILSLSSLLSSSKRHGSLLLISTLPYSTLHYISWHNLS